MTSTRGSLAALALLATVAAPAAAYNYLLKPAPGTSIPVRLVTNCLDGSPSCYEGRLEIEGYEEFSPNACDFHFGEAHATGEIPGLDDLCLRGSDNPVCMPASQPLWSTYNTVCEWRAPQPSPLPQRLYLDHFHRLGSQTMRVQVSYPGQTAYVWADYWTSTSTVSTHFQFIDPSCVASKGLLCAGNTLPCCEDIFLGAGSCLTGTTVMAVGTY